MFVAVTSIAKLANFTFIVNFQFLLVHIADGNCQNTW